MGVLLRRVPWIAAGVLAAALWPEPGIAQTVVVTGRVLSEARQPLAGASVAIPELGVGGVASAEGRFTFTVDASRARGRTVNVVARFLGYKPKRLPVTLTGERVEHEFVLERDVLQLEQVVVTGTSGATEQRKATFSVGVVDATQLREAPAISPIGGLQGKIAGASVIATSGQPGSAPAIRLRAPTSLTGRQDPLIIIDGTISRITMADINSEDIERIEIIKGAAASSLYGSDAANGVIQIFTRRGAGLGEGQTSFTFRNEYGQSYLPRVLTGNMSHPYRIDPATGDFLRDANGNRIGEPDGISDNPYPVYFDQLRQLYRPGAFWTNYISVGQRRGGTNYNASFQNTKETGVLNLLKGYSRQNFRINLDHAFTDKLDLSTGAFYARSRADQTDSSFGIFFGLRFLEPNVNLLAPNADGTPYNAVIRQPPLSGNVSNPLYVLSQQDITNDRDRFTGTFRASYRPLPWLTAEANLGYDEANITAKEFTPVGFLNSVGGRSRGSLFQRAARAQAYNTGVTLTAVTSWRTWLRNTTRAAFVYEDQVDNRVELTAQALTVPRVTEFQAAARDPDNPLIPFSRTEEIRTQNYYVVTTFDIRDRYIIDGLLRRDESSLFGARQRGQTYHRLSGAWRLTEDFPLSGIDELKLRASFGTAGLRPVFSAQYEVFDVSEGSPQKVSLGNPDLKPAFSRELELGFNTQFLRDYTLEYSYSEKNTTDQILNVPVSAATGYQNQWLNAGSLWGLTHEVAFGAVLLSKADYFWRVNITGDRTRQRITDLRVGAFLIGPNPNDPNTRIFRIAKGERFGVIYGARWIRTEAQLLETIRAGRLTGTAADYVKNEEGFYVPRSDWRTVNEKPLRYWQCTDADCTTSTRTMQIGDVNPEFTLGLNSNAQWRSLSATAVVSWVKGGNIYNYTRHWPFNELRDPVFDQRSKPEEERKPTTYYSEFYNNFDANDYFVENGTYVRLRELALNWNVPQRFVRRVPGADFRSARIGIVGRNLWTSTKYSGYDPDVSGPGGGNPFAYRVDYFTYPTYRTFTAMLELGF
ncbi:MAG: SusC/RagA family TonB-linked outer membrane protein [Gemmatimonadaceae bacterium]